MAVFLAMALAVYTAAIMDSWRQVLLLVATCTTRLQTKPNPDGKTQQARQPVGRCCALAATQQQLTEKKQTQLQATKH